MGDVMDKNETGLTSHEKLPLSKADTTTEEEITKEMMRSLTINVTLQDPFHERSVLKTTRQQVKSQC